MMDLDRLGSTIVSSGVAKCRSDVSVMEKSPLSTVPLTEYSRSLLKSLSVHAREHYPSCSYGVYPIEDDSAVAIVLVANRYSPNNFWCVFFGRVISIGTMNGES